MKRYTSFSLVVLLLLTHGSAQAAVGSLPSYVTSTPPLSPTEKSVSTAYLALFGRAPDLGGLNYWSGLLGPNATVPQAVNFITSSMASSNLAPLNAANPEYVEYVYANMLGKSVEEDQAGIKFWTDGLNAGAYASRGDLIQVILQAAAATTDTYSRDMFSNRMLAQEAACRLQKARTRSLDYQDSQTLLRRITDSLASYNAALEDMNRLTSGIASAANQWDQSYTASSIFSEARPLSGNNGRVYKHLVWYNRSGQMMLAHVFMPASYNTAWFLPSVISVHGGGWREGFIEKLQKYNTAIIQNRQYVVFAPGYRLTAYGYVSPAMQSDIEDFINLVRNSASAFRLDPVRIGLFGESAGGHLVNLLGAQA